jgi:hypothetical protein
MPPEPPEVSEMMPKVHPEEVRALVARIFRQHGAVAGQTIDLLESALFDDGRCVAWSYRLTDLMAMWFVEIGILQFYDAEGNLLHTLSLHGPARAGRVAA